MNTSLLIDGKREQLPYASENERLQFLATLDEQFPVYFSFVERYHERDPQLLGAMYDLLLVQKGLVVGGLTALYRRLKANGDPENLRLLKQLAIVRNQIAALYERGDSGTQSAALRNQANQLEHDLASRSTSFAQQRKLSAATWQQVHAALQPSEAAVEVVKYEYFDGRHWTKSYNYVALVLTPETTAGPRYVALGDAAMIEHKVASTYLEAMRGIVAVKKTRGTGPIERGAVPIERSEVEEGIWRQLEPALGTATLIYLSPDGVLNQVAPGLLRTSDGRLALERYDLRIVNSTRDLLRQHSQSTTSTAMLVGNPAFALSEQAQREALARLTQSHSGAAPRGTVELANLSSNGIATMRSANLKGGSLPRLPQTGEEIAGLSKLLAQRDWKVTSYTGELALKSAVMTAAHPRVLHIATHGFFLADEQPSPKSGIMQTGTMSLREDPMLRSGLYLAGADRALSGQMSSDLDDGILTAYEASSLDLNGTELVVLSACDTGLGQLQAGEGVFGLRRALQEAGADAFLMSMRSVPDRETLELMTSFYRNWLSGQSKPEALRAAELQEREVVRQRYGYDIPAYWGGFVLVGN